MKPYYGPHAGITIYHADCRDMLPSLKVDVIVADLPYNCGKNYGETTNDRMPWPEWCAWWDGCLDLMLAAAPNVFAFLSQTAWKHYARLGRHEIAWTAVWSKPLSLAVCALPFMPHWEPITYWGKTRKSDGAFWGSDVLSCNVARSRYGHPTEKPERLLRDLLMRFGRVTICDPFAGSGTTLRAAKDLGLSTIGVEINAAYCDMAIRRLQRPPERQLSLEEAR